MSKINPTPKRNKRKQTLVKATAAGLSDKEFLFCQWYTNNNELRGNGVQAYGKAFNLDLSTSAKYNVAKSNASKLLSRLDVLKCIQSIFENDGLSETTVQNEHSFILRQNSDFGSKLGAVRLWYEINGRLRKVQEPTAMQFNINIEDSRNKTVDVECIEINKSINQLPSL